MSGEGWDDDAGYQRARGRAWFMVAVASCCSLVAVVFVVLAVLGVGVFVALVDALTK
ncbi:hypothetical protein [Streptomyces sp. NBC_00645]|uniref:hypothetical protein n=1 Tax=Streptomyces sp. NBC_00645 TaxID=2975795 RepID=UPI0032486D23